MQLQTNMYPGVKFSKFLSQALALILMDRGMVIAMQVTTLILGYAVLQFGRNPINITIISILNLFISIAIIYRLYAIKHGASSNFIDCMRISFERGPKVVLAMFLLTGLGLLVVIPVFTAIASTSISGDSELTKGILSILYAIMATFLLLGGCFVKILIIIEKLNPLAALKQSFKLSFRIMPKLILVWFVLIYCLPYISLFIFDNIVVHALSTIWLLICTAFLIVVYDFLTEKNK